MQSIHLNSCAHCLSLRSFTNLTVEEPLADTPLRPMIFLRLFHYFAGCSKLHWFMLNRCLRRWAYLIPTIDAFIKNEPIFLLTISLHPQICQKAQLKTKVQSPPQTTSTRSTMTSLLLVRCGKMSWISHQSLKVLRHNLLVEEPARLTGIRTRIKDLQETVSCFEKLIAQRTKVIDLTFGESSRRSFPEKHCRKSMRLIGLHPA